jgi:hypothetical protein
MEEYLKTNKLRVISAALATMMVLGGCATGGAPDGRVAANTFGQGVKNLILAPFMIVAGVAQGIAFLPYTVGTGLNELNKGLLQANAVPLDDSYKATFGVSIADQRVDQSSGKVKGQDEIYGQYRPEAIFEANRSLQRLLVSQGMPEKEAKNYILTGNYRYAFTRNQILLAIVHRNVGEQPIRVAARQTGIVTTFRPDKRGWYEPYERDVNNQPLDEVVDWVAMEYKLLRQEKVVATMMVLSVESIKAGKRSPDYWQVEGPWMAGETTEVIRQSQLKVKAPLPST